jgi:hypothetical protein
MRTSIAVLLWLSALGLVVAAQPPRSADPPAIIIKPMRSGESSNPETQDKSGFVVIRPNAKGTTTQVAEPKPTSPLPAVPGMPVAGILNVPPPAAAAPAADKDGKVLFDFWFAVGIDGQRAGYVNWSGHETMRNDKPYLRGSRYLKLTISRFGQSSPQWGEESTVETPDGRVLLTSMSQGLGKDQSLELTGIVSADGKKLSTKAAGVISNENEIPWPEGVVGLVREPRLFKELNLMVGESFDYPSYIPSVNWVAKSTLTFDGEEMKVLWPNTPARKLLKFTTRPAPIGKVKLPASTNWVDAETFEPLMLETDFPALGGRLTFLRTTKEAANAPITRPVEIFNAQAIRLNREIPGIHSKESVVYRVSVPRDDEPETVFASEPRQQLKNLDPKSRSFELHVTARHGPVPTATPEAAPGKEFTASNYFINWDNDLVKAHAAKAVAGLPFNASAWDKAVAVERWVKQNMKAFEFTQAMATADNVAKTLSGDCTEYAMLAAAMCRAVGVPSRTALGVVYAPSRDGKPIMAYHMWTEVFAEGQWLPIDATLGNGGIGPGHIKITDHSWYQEKTLAPLMPVLRSLNAKPGMDVVRVSP